MPLVVVNPAAGRGRVGRLFPRIEAWLRVHAPGARLVLTREPGHAEALVREAPEERIVAVGGDGTVHEALRGLRQAQVFGVVPVGSGNDFARMLGLPKLGLEAALERALKAPPRRVDLGLVNGEPFGASLGLGFDAGVARRALSAPRFLRGMPRYLYALFLELQGLSLPVLRLEAGGEVLFEGPALLAAVMNGSTYGGGFPIAPMADPADGRLEAIVAGRFSRMGVVGILPRLMRGTHINHPRVHHFQAPAFTVRFDRPTPAHADGEVLRPRQVYEVRLVPGGLRVAV